MRNNHVDPFALLLIVSVSKSPGKVILGTGKEKSCLPELSVEQPAEEQTRNTMKMHVSVR